jgi:hypothetical protein
VELSGFGTASLLPSVLRSGQDMELTILRK